MNNLREAAREAERIITLRRNEGNPAYERQAKECLDMLREALYAEPAQPFCYLKQTSSSKHPPHGWAVHFTEGDVPLYTAPQPPADVPLMTDEELLGAIARGWCHKANEHKTMDPDLGVAIAEEVRGLVEAEVRRRMGVVG